jgi:Spy/CpxP family protein refolding chaperone
VIAVRESERPIACCWRKGARAGCLRRPFCRRKLKEQRRQLVEDEKRLRDNLAAAGRDTALYKQTLEKLSETEATITTLSTATAKAAAQIETAKEQLQDFVSALTL